MKVHALMTKSRQPALTLFAIGLIGLGALALVYGDFALVWQPVAAWVPGRTALAYASGLIMLVGGVGLLFERSAAMSMRMLFPYLVVWTLLKVPGVIAAPKMEAVYLGLGEIAVLMAGGWTHLEALSERREKHIRAAQILFGISLLPIGLAHIVYVKQTAEMVPSYFPNQAAWAYSTGAGQIAAGLGVLFGILPRLAAAAEAGMLTIFTMLVWGPMIIAAPTTRMNWTGFFISWVIAAAAWVVAANIKIELSS